jgi:hypothetical protein
MLFSPVYTEAHPLQNAPIASRMNLREAVHAASRPSSVFSNPFRPYPFRTLCKIRGIGYPLTLSTLRDGRVSTFSPSLIRPQSLPVIQPFRFQSLTDSCLPRAEPRGAQWSAATTVFSYASGLFPSPWGVYPLYGPYGTSSPKESWPKRIRGVHF